MYNAINDISVDDLQFLSVANLMKVESYIEEAFASGSWPSEGGAPLFAEQISHQLNCAPTHHKVSDHLLAIIRHKYREVLEGIKACDCPPQGEVATEPAEEEPSYLEDHLPE